MVGEQKIYAVNPRRVKKVLGLEVDDYTELSENEEFWKKISEYKEYFVHRALTTKECLREFYDKTGLVLAYEVRDNAGMHYFSMYGHMNSHEEEWFNKFRNEDILVTSKTGIMKFATTLQEDESRAKPNESIKALNYDLSFAQGIEEQVKLLTEYIKVNDLNVELRVANVKQIVTNIFGEIFVLYDDGVLTRNFQPYEKGIDGIFVVDSLTAYLIFKNGIVEALNWGGADRPLVNGRYDKVTFDKNFLAVLKNKRLMVVALAWGWRQNDMSTVSSFNGVDDVELVYPWLDGNDDPIEEMLETELHIRVGENELVMSGVPIVDGIFEE